MSITDEALALKYFDALIVRHLRLTATSRDQAGAIERSNLGYFAGYYDHETRARVERLFNCAHPIFGAIAEKGPPTAEEAFMAGVALATGHDNEDEQAVIPGNWWELYV